MGKFRRPPIDEDSAAYWHYTGPQRLHKALNTLEGLFRGIAADGDVSQEEIAVVTHWIEDHAHEAHRHPFNELIPALETVLEDGVIDEEEIEDILWLCEKMSAKNPFFDHVTSDMQQLHGMLAGIASDGKITEKELSTLRDWMERHEHLKTCWPFDEIESLILSVLADGRIDNREHAMLVAYFEQFLATIDQSVVEMTVDESATSLSGLCAVCPDVVFPERRFCFTGKSARASRTEIAATVERFGGAFSKAVSGKVDYLIVGADGNPSWAFSCYGRKVEQAVELRKRGSALVLVHEHDFWDAVADTEVPQ